MPLLPATESDPALDSVTVRVSDCPAEILLELAVIETMGVEPDPAAATVIVVCDVVLPCELVAVAV